MRRLLMLAIAVLALGAASPAPAKNVVIQIAKTGFSPATAAVAAGDTVTWKNVDTSPHQVVSDAGAFRSNVLQPGQTFSHTFDSGGTFAYHGGLHPNLKGSIVVNAVSVTLSRRVAIAGAAIRLGGSVSSGRAGETVRIAVRPYGAKARQVLVSTDANGEWSLRVHPLIRTTYQASWNGATSRQTVAFVRPRIGFRRIGRSTFGITVLGADSFAGRYVTVARWLSRTHHFRYLRRVYLTDSATTDNLSVAHVRLQVRHGTRLRVFMSRSQAGPGYLDGHSNFIVA